LSAVPLNSSSNVHVQLPASPSGTVPWQPVGAVVVVLGGLVVVVVVLLGVVVVVVVAGAEVLDFVVVVVVVDEPWAIVVVVVDDGGCVVVVVVLNRACAWSWDQEAEAGPVESRGVTSRVAVTAAAEAPAKSAIARLPRILSNNIPPSPLGSLHRLVVRQPAASG
jgi:hypothetical protein